MEPQFKAELFPRLWASNRHRFEYRWRPQTAWWRYRTRLAFSYVIPESPLTPFTSSEIHYNFDDKGFNEIRNLLGVSYNLNPSTGLNLAYIFRLTSENQAWLPHHGMVLSLQYHSREDGIFQMQAD